MRVQWKRCKGWRKPANAVYVGRSKNKLGWGNPYTVKEYGRDEALRLYEVYLKAKLAKNPLWLESLRGKLLMCWCRLDQPCHADIIARFLEETSA